MKYDSNLVELKNVLPTAKNILIAISADASVDKLAAALSLFLTLQSMGKQVTIACDDTIKVGQSHLFGVDHIQKNVPSTEGGNLTLTLEGVAASDNTIPALEKLDWYAENNNLNLVFHILPGQTFQPAKIVPHYQGSGFNLIFTIGALNLTALGSVYSQNQQAFSGTHVVNIDTQAGNPSYGQTNVLDTNASSVSEVMSNVIQDLGFSLSADVASNLIAGIFDATNNLTNDKATAETYMAVANCLRVGGKKPTVSNTPAFDWSGLMPKDSSATQPQQPVPNQIPDYAQITTTNQPTQDYAMPTVTPSDVAQTAQPQTASGDASMASPEERPAEEGVISETVEPEWLTPKIFKGSSIG